MFRDMIVLEILLWDTFVVGYGLQSAFSSWFFGKNWFLVKIITNTGMLEGSLGETLFGKKS